MQNPLRVWGNTLVLNPPGVLRSSRWIQSLDSTQHKASLVAANVSDIHPPTFLCNWYHSLYKRTSVKRPLRPINLLTFANPFSNCTKASQLHHVWSPSPNLIPANFGRTLDVKWVWGYNWVLLEPGSCPACVLLLRHRLLQLITPPRHHHFTYHRVQRLHADHNTTQARIKVGSIRIAHNKSYHTVGHYTL